MRYLFLIFPIVILLASCGSEEDVPEQKTKTTKAVTTVSKGEKLFKNNCYQCHAVNNDKLGPALAGVMERWDNDTARVHAFIKNSAALIKAGDPRAIEVFEKWNKTLMTPMTHLTDADMDEILKYIALETGK